MHLPPTIADYYRSAVEGLKREIEVTPDHQALGMEADRWIDYLIARWGMAEIVIDESGIELSEVETEHRSRGYDIYSNRGPGEIVKKTAIQIRVPVELSDTVKVIWEQKLAPNMISLSHPYPPFQYDGGAFVHIVQPDASSVKRGREFISEMVRKYNDSIRTANADWPRQVRELATKRLEQLRQKHKRLDDLSAELGIPLRKKADVATVIPTSPKVRGTIAPVLPPVAKPQARPVLEADKFNAIMDLIDNSGRQFERTPQSFQQLTEEGLRDIVLGSLNAVFEGAAGGEVFQGIGKVDIHLRITQGEVFVAEIKFWDGPETLRKVVGQLRGRLTWRDAYGVAIVLSKNAGFSEVLRSIRDTIPKCAPCANNL